MVSKADNTATDSGTDRGQDLSQVISQIDQPDWKSKYVETLQLIAEHIKPPNPVEVRFEGVTWKVHSKRSLQRKIHTVGSVVIDVFGGMRHMFRDSANIVTHHILHDVTGVLRPGQMTLVLGKPGCGKSSFLKMLAHGLRPDKRHILTGSVTYNGERADSGSFAVKRIVTYIDQHDTHLPMLTVAETINFAFQMLDEYHVINHENPNSSAAQLMRLMNERNLRVNHLLQLYGLDHVRDTLVGDDLVRGISGGQRKRVTLCEKIVGNFRVLLGDQISSGLDTATTIDIMTSIRHSTNVLQLTTAISLLQPPPEVFALFDNVLILDQGQVAYLGPASSVLEHFGRLGYTCPPNVDTADFLQEITSPEGAKFYHSQNDKAPPQCGELVQAYHSTNTFQDILATLATPAPTLQWQPQQKSEFLQSWGRSAKILLQRQIVLTKRNKELLRVQLGQANVMGLIIGSLFYKLGKDQYSNKYGLMFLTTMIFVVGGMPALTVFCEQRPIFYKQRDAGFFRTSSFVLAQGLATVPVSVAQVLSFGTLMWWMSGMTSEVAGSRYGMFLAVSFCMSFALGQLLRSVAAFTPNPNVATPISGMFITFMILLSGFIIREHSIPPYWIWLYWLNPSAWCIRAYAILEFTSTDYNTVIRSASGTISTLGDLYLEAYGFRKEMKWVWAAVLYLLGFLSMFGFITWLSLEKMRQVPEPSLPEYGEVKRDGSNGNGNENGKPHHVEMTVFEPNHKSQLEGKTEEDPVLPFTPVSLTFDKVWYTVQVKDTGTGTGIGTGTGTGKRLRRNVNLDLLQGVSGFATPGTLTALMGSSGAGKTTLLDVIAGRKTTGTIRGDILLNGHKKDQSLSRMMGYVEQADVHSPHSTVLEALIFSASLRLPPHTATVTCHAFVQQVMRLLELGSLRDDIVGKEGEGGLSTEQRKRLTIGVELVANPSVLFLDEPTTGLDSRAAAVVMRVVHNIAATKRTVVCTIHQPSEYLFRMFDRLLLLKRGGKTVYFGPLGENSRELLGFLHAIPGVVPMNPGSNPATYMLEVIGGSIDAPSSSATTSLSAAVTVDAAELYDQSALRTANDQELETLKQAMATQAQLKVGYGHAPPLHVQFTQLTIKNVRGYWRTPSYNLSRTLVCTLVACIFGSVYKRGGINTQSDVISHFSIMIVGTAFTSIIYLTSVVDMVIVERAVFYRERSAAMYSTTPFAISFVIAELPYIAFNSLLFSVVFYFTVGLYDTGVKFGYFWMYYMLTVTIATFCGQMLSCIAPSGQSALVIGLLLMNLWITFSGFMISPHNIPDYWIWLHWMSPLHYLLEGLVVTQFHEVDRLINVVTSKGQVVMTVEAYVLEHFGGDYTYAHRGYDVLALIMFIVGFNIIRILALKFVKTIKR